MNMKMCATSDVAKAWNSIDWNKANAYVKKLQMRIVKAHQQGRTGKVKSLQWLLTHSFYGRALAVKRVTSNKGKKTAGVDKILWSTIGGITGEGKTTVGNDGKGVARVERETIFSQKEIQLHTCRLWKPGGAFISKE